MRILIVEDEPRLLRNLGKALRDLSLESGRVGGRFFDAIPVQMIAQPKYFRAASMSRAI